DIRNNKAYKEYYACATGDAAPKPKASARKKKGDSASSTTPPTPTPTTTVVAAPRLSATAKGTDEGTGSRPGVPDVPSDDSEEELSWNSSDDEEGDEQTKGREESEGDKTDEIPGGAPGKQRVIVCYNCKSEGHMSKQCIKPRRKRDAEWFKDK
nr:hypothetical protein [Tanacetum cinerariifolium]